MIDTYRFTMPTPQRALELGFKLEGQCQRTHLWLCGVAFTLEAIESPIVFMVTKYKALDHRHGAGNGSGEIEFATDNIVLFYKVWEKWQPYGIECTLIGGRRSGVDITEANSVKIE
jgi:hypothetical protein